MSKTTLEQTIKAAATQFALQVVEMVKGASLQELLELQEGATKKPRRGRRKAAEVQAEPIKVRRNKKTAKKRVVKKRVAKKRAAKKK